MDIVARTLAWFANPANWQGSEGIPNRLVEHVQIAGLALALAALVALPVGFFIGHTGRGAFLAVNLSNVGRAIPSFAILSLALPFSLRAGLGISFWPTFAALFALAIPPIVTNTFVALREVDRDLVEAARGMGMREGQVLRRVEIPLATPVILTGLRVAAVQVVATATLGAVIGGGGLGRYIVDGIARQETDMLLGGAILVALLAIATELLFAFLQRRAASAGLGTPGVATGPSRADVQATRPAT